MRWIIVAVCRLAAIALIAASMMLNWWFWRGQGPDEATGLILGTISLGVDAFKSTLPILINTAWTLRRWLACAIGSVFLVACIAFSFLSGLGSAASLRGTTTAERQAMSDRFAAVRQDLAGINAQIAMLGTPRPSTVLEAELVKAKHDRRWQISDQCRDATGNARAFCQSVAEIGIELNRALEYERLQEKRDGLAKEAERLERAGARRDADPQAAFLGRMFGLTLEQISTDLSLLLAILVELGGAFGLYLAMLARPNNEPPRQQPPTLPQAPTKLLSPPTRFVRGPDGQLMIE